MGFCPSGLLSQWAFVRSPLIPNSFACWEIFMIFLCLLPLIFLKLSFFKKILSIIIPFTGFYRTQYPASYTHKSLGRTRQFTLPASPGTQTCVLSGTTLGGNLSEIFDFFCTISPWKLGKEKRVSIVWIPIRPEVELLGLNWLQKL